MKYKLTILNSFSIIYLILCVSFLIIKWKMLNRFEGWGILGMEILIGIGLFGLLLDLVLKLIIKNKNTLNIIEKIIVWSYILLLAIFFYL
jgi:hypothetical protein